MKHHARGSREPHSLDPDFVDALCEDESNRKSSRRQAERKTQQFCRQVQRALNLAIAVGGASNNLAGLFVEEVLPAPDCGHLLAYVVIPDDCRIDEAIRGLRNETTRLRSEVAMAITRKRAPELSFLPVRANGGADD